MQSYVSYFKLNTFGQKLLHLLFNSQRVKNYTVQRYTYQHNQLWNSFLEGSKNGTFLFHRDFMEYHSDRFSDYSLIVFENDKPKALFPANHSNDTLYSHQGLTYGGVIVSEDCKLTHFLKIFEAILDFLKREFKKLYIKVIPNIYNSTFSDELLYGLFLQNATLVRRDTFSVIDLKKPIKISNSRKYEIKKGVEHQIEIQQTSDFSDFWNNVLTPNLNQKHKVNPVHTLGEITYLHSKFPNNITQFNALYNGQLVAGATMFVTDRVAHVQYISSTELRSMTGALDYLFDYLIKFYKDKVNYFDFGTSNENQGRSLNEGLLFWKESFGAKTVVQDFYELALE